MLEDLYNLVKSGALAGFIFEDLNSDDEVVKSLLCEKGNMGDSFQDWRNRYSKFGVKPTDTRNSQRITFMFSKGERLTIATVCSGTLQNSFLVKA